MRKTKNRLKTTCQNTNPCRAKTVSLQVKLETPSRFNCVLIPLTRCKFAIVDKIHTADLQLYKWRAVLWNFRWYAVSTRRWDGTPCQVSMHRLIAKTPPGDICHHQNTNSLDNRRGNLLNQMPLHHRQLHGIRKFGRKNKKITTIKD